MRIEPGVPTTCPACGGVYEGPTTYLDDNGVTRRLAGHVQGGAICKERAPAIRKRSAPPPAPAPTTRFADLSPAEREARESAVRAKLQAEKEHLMPEKKFELGDYVEVKDRIARLYEFFPQARIETDYHLTSEPDDRPKVIVRALVYRNPDDEKPAGHGTSWLYLPGSTPYTKGSEIENAETSAVGRAIGMLGILIMGGMASKQEIDNKAGESDRPGIVPTKEHPAPERVRTDDGGLIGTASVGKSIVGFQLQQHPTAGHVLEFRLEQGRKGIKVIAYGPLAESLATLRPTIEGQRVICWGRVADESFPKDGKTITYPVMTLERIQTPDGVLPVDDVALPEPPDDLQLVGEVA